MPKLSKADKAAEDSASRCRLRKERALARIREMEADEKAGRLVPTKQVEAAWADVRAKIKGAVLRLPDKCAPQLAELSDPREVRAVLVAECEAILQNLADEIRATA